MQLCNKTNNARTAARVGQTARLRAVANTANGTNLIALDQLPPAALEHVANYFRTLSEPMRLRILNALDTDEMSVGDIAQKVDSSAANVSRHLSQLARHGLIARSSHGKNVCYRIADPAVHALCQLVCGSIARNYDQSLSERAAFAKAQRGAARRVAAG